MIQRFTTLPFTVRIMIAVVAAALAMAGLLMAYDWLGTRLLDSGGIVG